MRFVYHKDAGEKELTLDAKTHTHTIKARRAKIGDKIEISNLNTNTLYTYQIDEIDRKSAKLILVDKTLVDLPSLKTTVVGWGMVDPKIVEKTLPMLNELGVKNLGLVRLEYSQGNFRYDYKRMERILINSSQQCGRMELMQIKEFDSLDDWLKAYPKSAWVNFGGKVVQTGQKLDAFLIGPEGGFSKKECVALSKNLCLGIDSPFILRSKSAVLSLCAKVFG
jgi:16S rRNA (uracil1498-N3)-methyltransferase